MKQLISSIALLIAFAASARDFEYGNLKYEVLDESAKTCAVKSGEHIIHMIIDGHDHGEQWYPGNKVEGVVTIPETVIDETQTEYTVTEIGFMAFAFQKITEVTVPRTVGKIDKSAFWACEPLESMIFQDGESELILNQMFASSNSRVEAYIPHISKLYMGRNGTADSGWSIWPFDTSYLKEITIGPTVNYLAQSAALGFLSGCTDLKFIIAPGDKDLTLDSNIFNSCSISEFVAFRNFFDRNEGGYRPYLRDTGCKKARLAGNVTIVSRAAFKDCADMEEILLEAPITSIEPMAFEGCSSLRQISIPRTVKSIKNAFVGCSSLQELAIPGSADLLDLDLSGCDNLKNLRIEDSAGFPGDNIFVKSKSSKLENVYIGRNYSNFYLFGDTPALKNLSFGDCVSEIPNSFQNCLSLENVVFPNQLRSIRSMAFYNCPSIKELNLPGTVESIENAAFFNNNFESVSIADGDGVVLIGTVLNSPNLYLGKNWVSSDSRSNMFKNLAKLAIGPKVSEIPSAAFENQTLISECVMHEGIAKIGNNAFRSCSGIRDISIPESVCEIGAYSFASMANLERIRLSPNIKYLPERSLAYAGSLKQIVIPEGVEGIGEYALDGIGADLRLISFPSTFKTWSALGFPQIPQTCAVYFHSPTPPRVSWGGAIRNKFQGCRVHVPAGCKDAYILQYETFGGVTFIDDVNIGHSAEPAGTSIAIEIPSETADEDYLRASVHRAEVYSLDADDNEFELAASYSFDVSVIQAVRSRSGRHTILLDGLECNTRYAYHVKSYNAAGDLLMTYSGHATTADVVGVEDVVAGDDNAIPADEEFYDLRGMRLAGQPQSGICIVRKGTAFRKMTIN